MTNSIAPGYIKVGRTNNLNRRLRDHNNASNVVGEWSYEWTCEVPNAEKAERMALDSLSQYKVSGKSEQFKVDLEIAKKTVSKTLWKWNKWGERERERVNNNNARRKNKAEAIISQHESYKLEWDRRNKNIDNLLIIFVLTALGTAFGSGWFVNQLLISNGWYFIVSILTALTAAFITLIFILNILLKFWCDLQDRVFIRIRSEMTVTEVPKNTVDAAKQIILNDGQNIDHDRHYFGKNLEQNWEHFRLDPAFEPLPNETNLNRKICEPTPPENSVRISSISDTADSDKWSIIEISACIIFILFLVLISLGSVGVKSIPHMHRMMQEEINKLKYYTETDNRQYGKWFTSLRTYKSGKKSCVLRYMEDEKTLIDISFNRSGEAGVNLYAEAAGRIENGLIFFTTGGVHYRAEKTNVYDTSAFGLMNPENVDQILNNLHRGGTVWLMYGDTVIQKTDLPAFQAWYAIRAIKECNAIFETT